MSVSCCYAVQDKTWVKDPDGNEWEVFVVLRRPLPWNSNLWVKKANALFYIFGLGTILLLIDTLTSI